MRRLVVWAVDGPANSIERYYRFPRRLGMLRATTSRTIRLRFRATTVVRQRIGRSTRLGCTDTTNLTNDYGVLTGRDLQHHVSVWLRSRRRQEARRTTLKLNTSSFANDPMREYSLHLWAGVTEKVDTVFPTGNIVREEGLPYNAAVAAKFVDGATLWGYWQHLSTSKALKPNFSGRSFCKQPMTDRGQQRFDRYWLRAGTASS